MKLGSFFRYRVAAIFASIVLLGKAGFAQAEPFLLIPETSEVRFEASSTLHDFAGVTNNISKVQIEFEEQTGQVQTLPEIQIPVSSLHTGDGARDQAMYKMFAAREHPYLIWKTDGLSCPPLSQAGDAVCHANGQFVIHGVATQHKIPVFLHRGLAGIQARGEISFTTDEFKLNPPSVLGLIRVDHHIRVFFNLFWKKAL